MFDLIIINNEREQGVNFINVFTCSFYARRYQKHKKDSQLKQLFALSGSEDVEAVRKQVDEIDPRSSPVGKKHAIEDKRNDHQQKTTFSQGFLFCPFPINVVGRGELNQSDPSKVKKSMLSFLH